MAAPVRPCVYSRAVQWIGAKLATLYTADYQYAVLSERCQVNTPLAPG